jgi:hypothetical protein
MPATMEWMGDTFVFMTVSGELAGVRVGGRA